MGLNILVWGIHILSGISPTDPTAQQLLAWGGNHLAETLRQPWRLIASMFMHAGIIHIAVNMFSLYQLGPLSESFYGRAGMLTIYFIAGILGAIASLMYGAAVTVSVGASGAIFGLQGAILCAVLTKGKHLPAGAAKQIASVMLFFIALNLYQGFVNPAIDNAAHIGGLVGGFLAALILAEKFDRKHFEKAGRMRLIITLVIGAILIIASWQLVRNYYEGQRLIPRSRQG
jgi:rhomboid protease GluP